VTTSTETTAPAPRAPRRLDLEPFRLQNAGVVYAFALIVAAVAILSALNGRSDYLGLINIANVLDQTSLFGILAIFTTITLISGNFDLSIGSIAALSGGLALSVLDAHGVAVAILLGLLSGVVLGFVNGILVQIVGINAFIVTLGSLTAVRGLVLILTNGQSVQPQSTALIGLGGPGPALNLRVASVIVGAIFIATGAWGLWRARRREGQRGVRPMILIGVGLLLAIGGGALFATSWSLTMPVYFLVALTVIAWAILRFTTVGRRLYAVGGNTEAARLSGINVARYKIVPFVLSGLSAAFIGILYASRFGAINPNALTGTELTVLASAILGGTSLFGGAGSVVKSVIGALILFTLSNGFNILNLGANYQGLIQGVVIIGAAAVYTVAGRQGFRREIVAQAPAAATERVAEPVSAAPKTGTPVGRP